MKFVSVGNIKNIALTQYRRDAITSEKINLYFENFLDTYSDFQYVWFENRLYFDSIYFNIVKHDIELFINREIGYVPMKTFPPELNIKLVDSVTVKRKIDRIILKKKINKEKIKNKIIDDFDNLIQNIKICSPGYRYIGCLDLEFWENDMGIILEFGWKIQDYMGVGQTTHFVIQENLNYKNGFYSKNNRFSRKDSRVVPLKIAKQKFKDEFLNKIDILVGHGLNNDIKVLQMNGITIDKKYYDTSDIGAVKILNRTDRISLENLLGVLNIPHDNLHNAANDVEFILEAFYEIGGL